MKKCTKEKRCPNHTKKTSCIPTWIRFHLHNRKRIFNKKTISWIISVISNFHNFFPQNNKPVPEKIQNSYYFRKKKTKMWKLFCCCYLFNHIHKHYFYFTLFYFIFSHYIHIILFCKYANTSNMKCNSFFH